MIYFIIAILIVLADQALKYFVTLELALGGQIALIPGVVHLTYVRNTGAAFSILTQYTWLLTIISCLATVLIIFLIIKLKIGTLGRLALGAVLGGAVGNLIDRVMLGYVVDMFEIEFLNFAVFNVADMFINVGGIVFCLYYIFFSVREQKPKPKKASAPSELFGSDSKLTETRILTEFEFDRLRTDDSHDPEMPDDDGVNLSVEDESGEDKD